VSPQGRAPRVLLSAVVLSQPMGGVRRHNQELLPRVAELLRSAGGSLTLMEGSQPIAFAVPDHVERLPSSVPAHPALVRATLEGSALRKHLAAAEAAGRRFDLLHTAHLPMPRHLPVRASLTLHDLRSLELAHTPMSRRLLARKVIGSAVETAACVLTVSETVRAQLLERFRVDPARVTVVPNAADHFTPLPRARGPEAPLLHVGHVEPRKNLELLVRALAHDRELPPLLLAGAAKRGEDERLRALASQLGVGERLRFLGAFDERELPTLYSTCACVVLPSRLEGFGIPALEAQRAGAPLAIARAGALPEVAGEDVPSFDPGDPVECAHAIRTALAAPPDELGRHAVRADRFRWDASAQLWLEAWIRATA
jgi:glycosyltransferase involved in cell wall biosynthesis